MRDTRQRRPMTGTGFLAWLGFVWLASSAAAGLARAENSLVPDKDAFGFDYSYQIPTLAAGQHAEIWLPLASSGRWQDVKRLVDTNGLPSDTFRDKDFGNEILHLSAGPAASGKTIRVHYDVQRREATSDQAQQAPDAHLDLRSEPLVPLNERFKKLADQVTAGKTTPESQARAIYDYVFNEMKYDKSGTGWGRGDAVYACDSKKGNCTDFHALFMALARSKGIPARFAIGFPVPPSGTAGKVEGYHCWAEFFAAGRWTPIDISEAAKAPKFHDYYFGHWPANRIELSVGRELQMQPPAKEGAVNFLVHPYVEVDGKLLKGTKAQTSFTRTAEPVGRS